jgi:hypothetical protein
MPMQKCAHMAAAMAALLLPSLTLAKDKAKSTLPTDVLDARTVAVLIDRNAGESLEDPQANRVAQKDVETALLNWGRYRPILSTQSADLIIVVRRGTGKVASGTIHDPREGNRPVAIDPTDNGIDIGIRHGRERQGGGIPPDRSTSDDGSQNGSMGQPPSPHPQAQIGGADDALLVYRGNTPDPEDTPPIWRYEAKNALKPHNVPAVEAFRKAVNEAERAAAKQP